MNIRLRNLFIFIGFVAATFLAHFLWYLPVGSGILSVLILIPSGILGLAAIHWFIKIFWPKYSFERFFNELLAGLSF